VKLLVDVGVGRVVEKWLASAGHDVLAVRNLNAAMKDHEVLAIAARDRRVVITMDKDFGELVIRSRKDHAGILLLRLDDADSAEKLQIVRHIFEDHADILTGNYCVYQKGRLRVRRV
jgi:predicted nuclease of predicted toxin-antitoxin system